MVLCTPATRFCSIPFDEIAKQATEPRKIVPVKALGITLESYNYYMDTRENLYIPIPELCPKLSQKWAQIACDKGAGGVFARNLRNFILVEEEYLELLQDRIQGYKENLGDIVKRMPLTIKTPTLVCNSSAGKPRYGLCISALKVGNNLVVVWVLGHSDSHKAALEQQAKTIRALVQFGFAEKGDFAALEAVLHNAHD